MIPQLRSGDPDLVALAVPLGDGLGGVDHQVQEHLAQAPLVRPHRRDVAVVADHPSAVADLVPGHAQGRLQHRPQLDGAPVLLVASPGEQPQVTHDLPDPAGRREGIPHGRRQLGLLLREARHARGHTCAYRHRPR